MKSIKIILVIVLLLFLFGCQAEEPTAALEDTTYSSDTAPEDCYLCGDVRENPLRAYWGQNNIGFISLNTFQVMPVAINRYDKTTGALIETPSGCLSAQGLRSTEGCFSGYGAVDSDRGYASGQISFNEDQTLDVEKAASFLCQDCLNEITSQLHKSSFGVAAVNFETREVRVLEEAVVGFGLGDFHISWHMNTQKEDALQINFLAFYCPLRYGAQETGT